MGEVDVIRKNMVALRHDHEIYIHDALHIHWQKGTSVPCLGEESGQSRETGCCDTLVDLKCANERNKLKYLAMTSQRSDIASLTKGSRM